MANVGSLIRDCEDLQTVPKVLKRKKSHHKKKESNMTVNGSKSLERRKSDMSDTPVKKKKIAKKAKDSPKLHDDPGNRWTTNLSQEDAGTSGTSIKKKRKKQSKSPRKPSKDNAHELVLPPETCVKNLPPAPMPERSTPAMENSLLDRTSTSKMVDLNRQGECDVQLTSNVLPPLQPFFPSSNLDLNIPSDGFRCSDCGDMFLLETSLTDHLQRRSILVTFICNCCRLPFTFFNRCNFLCHIRMHREKQQACDASKAQVFPLPRNMFISGEAQLCSAVNAENQKPSVNTLKCPECSATASSPVALEDHFTCAKEDLNNMPQCTKCEVLCPSRCFLTAHERLHSKSKPFVCPECGRKFLDSWELFHQHLTFECLHYSRRLGHRCPACPCLFANKDVQFRHCVNSHGEHYFKCQGCPMAFKSETAFSMHQKTSHGFGIEAITIHKCPLCDAVFRNGEDLRTHFDGHVQATSSKNSKFVFLCPKCTLLCETKSSLHNHLRTVHPNKLDKFACPICAMSFETLEQLIYHRNTDHAQELPNIEDTDQVPSSPKVSKIVIKKPTVKKSRKKKSDKDAGNCCDQCGQNFHTLSEYSRHKSNCREVNAQCLACELVIPDRNTMRSHAIQHLSEGLHVCTLCNSPVFNTKLGLANHLNSHVTSMQFPLDCETCGESLADSNLALRHFKTEHGVGSHVCQYCKATYSRRRTLLNHQKSAHSASASRVKFACWICSDRKFHSSNMLVKHMMNKHKMPAEEIDIAQLGTIDHSVPVKIDEVTQAVAAGPEEQPNEDEQSCSETRDGNSRRTEEKQDDDKKSNFGEDSSPTLQTLQCAKCGFAAKDKLEFASHIVSHKEDKDSHQCSLCGLCFVVETSLKRHLKAVHRVKNFQQFLSVPEEGFTSDQFSSDTDMGSLIPEAGTSVSATPKTPKSECETEFLECTVCYRTFDSEIALKTHMRTHGMAFIRSKRFQI